MNNNIFKVLEELGKVLMDKDNEIVFQKYEIERLQSKIEQLEQYANFYSKE